MSINLLLSHLNGEIIKIEPGFILDQEVDNFCKNNPKAKTRTLDNIVESFVTGLTGELSIQTHLQKHGWIVTRNQMQHLQHSNWWDLHCSYDDYSVKIDIKTTRKTGELNAWNKFSSISTAYLSPRVDLLILALALSESEIKPKLLTTCKALLETLLVSAFNNEIWREFHYQPVSNLLKADQSARDFPVFIGTRSKQWNHHLNTNLWVL